MIINNAGKISVINIKILIFYKINIRKIEA